MKFLLVEYEPTTALANKERQLYDLAFTDILRPQVNYLEELKARAQPGDRLTATAQA